MSRPLRIECYLIPLYRFWALTSECECAFSHRMPIRDATVRHSVRGAPPRGHKVIRRGTHTEWAPRRITLRCTAYTAGCVGLRGS